MPNMHDDELLFPINEKALPFSRRQCFIDAPEIEEVSRCGVRKGLESSIALMRIICFLYNDLDATLCDDTKVRRGSKDKKEKGRLKKKEVVDDRTLIEDEEEIEQEEEEEEVERG
uniref:Uncharacterized protein n=1 Tax=Vespula pensylvanica TaxID=30213 RepID=A0A834KNJ7_VESPE|nr:hypothetical protein H0235_013898 [Vespula pensylvanica]